MDEAMDKIVIEVDCKSTDAETGLSNLAKTLKKLKGLCDKAAGIDESGATKVKSLADSLESLANAGGSEKMAAALSNLRKITKLNFSNLTGVGAAAQNVADLVNSASTATVTGTVTPAASAVSASTGSPLDGTIPMGSETVTETTSAWSKFSAVLSKFPKVLSAVGKGFGMLKERVAGCFSKLTKFFSSLKRIAMYRLIRTIISAITKGFKDGMDACYQYSKTIDGTFAKSMDRLATSYTYMKSSLGAMVAPIITLLTPAIEYLIDKFVDLLNVVNQVFARLSGATTWTKAIKVETEYAKATNAAADANANLKKSLLGIDELNVLSNNTDSDSSATSGYKYEEVPIDTGETDKLIDRLKDILWYVGAITLGIKGWDLAKFIGQLAGLSGGKLTLFGAGATLAITSLIIEVKGLIDIISSGINWENFLESIGGAAGVTAGGALIGAAFGSAALGAGVGAIIGGIPLFIVGIWDACKEGLDWLSAALIGAGATAAGAGIGAIIGACGGPIGAGIGALIGLAVGALTDLVILIVQNWESIQEFFAPAWEWFYGTIIEPIWSFLSGVATWFYNNVIKPIVDFFAPIFQAIGEIASLIFTKVAEIVSGIGQAIWSIITKIGEIFAKIVEIFVALGKAAYTYIIKPIIDFVVSIAKTVYEKALKPIGQFFAKIGTWLYDHIIKPIWDKIVWLKDKAVEVFKSIGTTVVEFVSGAFKSVINGVLSGIEWCINGFIKMLNGAIGLINKIPGVNITEVSLLNIPRLAEGGQLNEGQLFVAREAGAELVGNIGGKTSVANNEQIIEGISSGVKDANNDVVSAIFAMANQIVQSIRDKDTDVYFDGTKVSRKITNAQNRTNRMYGTALQNT